MADDLQCHFCQIDFETREKIIDILLPPGVILFSDGAGMHSDSNGEWKFVSFRKGDIIVLVDSTWRSQAMLNTLFNTQYHKGIKLGAMFHDLFPLLLPDTCDEITTRGFIDWFCKIIPQADFFIMNSETTRLSLQKFLEKNSQLRRRPYASGYFRLGAELDLANERSKKPWYLNPLREAPGMVILGIGTI